MVRSAMSRRANFYLLFTSPEIGQTHLPVLNSEVSLLTEVYFMNLQSCAVLARKGAVIQIDTVHSRAICDEIGDRLRDMFQREPIAPLPPRLQYLIEQLAKAERETAPSIVPSLEEMGVRHDEVTGQLRTASSLHDGELA